MDETGRLTADYLVIGTGAVGMAFVDTMLTETDASFIMVDRKAMPGGHWNDAYPFVRLHQPSAFYGVSSTDLGSNRIDTVGPNAGFYELASGAEVSAYFETVMQERFLPSGRVRYFPMHDHLGDGIVRSMVSGKTMTVDIGKRMVDATFFQTSVPSTHDRPYRVEGGAVCIAPNALPRMAGDFEHFAILGGGKTAMDTGVWLLNQGADPEAITWVVPRGSWLINRETTQPGAAFFGKSLGGFAKQVEAIRDGTSVEDIFLRLEAADQMLRIDEDTLPGMFHFATISTGEVEQLRRIRQTVKGRHVAGVRPTEIELVDGERIPMPPKTLYIDCTASAVPFREKRNVPVFQDRLITLQAVRAPLVTLSAAVIAFVEAHVDDIEEQNRLCAAIELADTPRQWLNCFMMNMMNQQAWGQHETLGPWLRTTRLDPFGPTIRDSIAANPESAEIMSRIGAAAIPAVMNIQKILAEPEAA